MNSSLNGGRWAADGEHDSARSRTGHHDQPARNEIRIKGMKCRTYLFANSVSSSVFLCKKEL